MPLVPVDPGVDPGFLPLANRSNSAAASDLIVALSVKEVSGVPGLLTELPGVDPVFLYSKELKKFAKTPSPPGVLTTLEPSNYIKCNSVTIVYCYKI